MQGLYAIDLSWIGLALQLLQGSNTRCLQYQLFAGFNVVVLQET